MDIEVIRSLYVMIAALVVAGMFIAWLWMRCRLLWASRRYRVVTRSPFRVVLIALAVGYLVAYGGSKPGPAPKDAYDLTIVPSGDTNGCKVVGHGVYAVGKAVNLKATPAAAKKKPPQEKTVFVGWYDASKVCLSYAASLKYVMPAADVTLEARFVTAAADKSNIVARVNGMDLMPWVSKTETRATVTNVIAGLYLEWPVVGMALTPTTVKVSGLPSGLKFAAKPVTAKIGSGKAASVVTNVPANTIYGVPAPSKFNKKTGCQIPSQVKITVTTLGKSVQTYQVDLTVKELPVWAYGTFEGHAALGEIVGAASMTVSSSGKISGKYAQGGTNWTFSATGYTQYVDDSIETNRLFAVDTIAKSGKLTRDLHIEMTPGWVTNALAYRLPDAWIMGSRYDDYVEACDAGLVKVYPYRPQLIPYTQTVDRVNCAYSDGEDSSGTELVLRRNIWTDKQWGIPCLSAYKNRLLEDERYPELKVSLTTKGKVTLSGKIDGVKVSSTSTAFLVPGDDDLRAWLLIPTTKKVRGLLDEVICPAYSGLWLYQVVPSTILYDK